MIKLTLEKFKEIRKKNDLSQEQLAEILGVHPQYISNIERGIKPVSYKLIDKLIQKGLYTEDKEPPTIQNELNLTEQDWELLTEIILSDRELLLIICKRFKTDRQSIIQFLFGNR